MSHFAYDLDRDSFDDIDAWFLFLPPCRPDLNPIKMAFAKLTALNRKAAARTNDQLWKAVGWSATSSRTKTATTSSKPQDIKPIARNAL